MTTLNTEDNATGQPMAPGDQPKRAKKARVAPRRAHVAPAKAKSAHKAAKSKPGKRAPKGRQKAAPVREGSKTAKVLAMLRQTKGATLKELVKATGWQAHSVRGFLSGTLGKKMGLALESNKGQDRERFYKIVR
jgi:hypothetical protein